MIELPVQLLDPSIPAPAYAHDGDAGLDLRSTISLSIAPRERAVVPCGIAIALPEAHAGLVVPRSGLAAKHGISIVNAPGLIDSGYRGEIKAVLVNLDEHESFRIERGDRIAQLVIVEVPAVKLVAVEELDDTERSTGGFGSTGVSQ